MHALMGKSSNKAPTPQDLYRARKQKERDERSAFLPPGLINHGNTCFMNSVLQGLIATPMLVDIVRFSLPESYAPVASRRSPQLTNGHGLGGEFEQGKEQSMPLGDTFVHLMQKAWRMQEERQRQSMSPKELLQRIGAKFDQYLDFRQQDAHEFLRHLLDAMRMEELDVIKKRQPPPPKPKRRRKTKFGNAPPPDSENIREEEHLTPFVDMVFGGRLASILVCENCKNISWTYEDFNDLSLSIKQEDYERAKRRDKLKTLAKKLGMRGRGVTRELDIPQGPRSSSVPSSPLRRSEEAERSFELVLNDVGPRRRSLEAGEAAAPIKEEGSSEVDGDASEQNTKPHTLGVPQEQEEPARGEENEDAKRERDEDGWVRMRRKISTSVGMGAGMKKDNKRKKREVILKGKEATSGVQGNDDSQADNATTTGDDDMVLDSYVDVKAPSPVPAASSTAVSPLLGATIALQKFSFARRPSSARTEPNTNANSPALSAVPSPPRTPDIPPVSLPPQEARSSRPSSPLPALPPPVQEAPIRTKSPRPFRSKPKIKHKRSKSLYLRRLLADVPSGSSSDVPEIRNAGGGSWPKLGLSLGFGQGGAHSVERCLRLFTGVEVLDGENMVGCRKCWKIQHGEHVSREESVDTDEDEEEGDEEEDIDSDDSEAASNSGASVRVNVQPYSSSQELSERVSVRSAPPSNIQEMEIDSSSRGVTYTPSSPALALPVPLISMTAAEFSTSEQTPTTHGPLYDTKVLPKSSEARGYISSASRDSLQLPRSTEASRHARQPAERSSRIILTSDTSSVSSGNNSADEDEEGEETEGETSLTASIRSDSSSVASSAPQESPGVPNSSVTLIHSSSEKASDRRQPVNGNAINGIGNVPDQKGVKSEKKSNTIPRSKQVIPRRAYKRYLVATPPPVLVVHLKRFQQVGRVPTSTTMHQFQFFSNFKKLDDPVSFPEYLDLEPFLLPKEDDIGRGGKKGRKKKYKGEDEQGEKAEGCMYRLYAVVVHIGNMLGGHYVAYTALPEPPPPSSSSSSSSSNSSSSSTKETLAVTASSASLSQPQTSTDSEKEIPPRPDAPRTASFARTAIPNLQHHFLSSSTTKTASRPSSSSGRGSGSTPQRQWCYISDTVVRLATLEEVLQAKAYICMYERI